MRIERHNATHCARYKTKRDTRERSPNVPVSAHKDGNCTVYPQAGPE